MPFLPPNQQCQSTEGIGLTGIVKTKCKKRETAAEHIARRAAARSQAG